MRVYVWSVGCVHVYVWSVVCVCMFMCGVWCVCACLCVECGVCVRGDDDATTISFGTAVAVEQWRSQVSPCPVLAEPDQDTTCSNPFLIVCR